MRIPVMLSLVAISAALLTRPADGQTPFKPLKAEPKKEVANPPEPKPTKNGDGLKKLPEAFRTALDKAEVLQLMSLVPEKAEGKVDDAVGGYEVRKIAKLKKGDDRAIALILLDEGLREADGIAKCFNPRHAIRVVHEKKTYELLICFECSQVHLFEDGKRVGDTLPISTSPQETYNRTIRNALK